ncbi:MAG: hypothetical protein SGI72_04445 [Planctomycetota bacterium]|nr:hypothetical protein [Planctomycetota bacterium]
MVDPKLSGDLDCDAARVEIHAFLGSANVGAKSPALRAHLARCVDCNGSYRELVVGIARIASGARAAADVRHDDDLAASARRSLIAAETRHRIRLPKSLLPLAVVVLIGILVMKSGANGVMLRAVEGTVYRGAELVTVGESVPASNGDGCSTSANSRAELARGDDQVAIEPESSFTIERLDRLAVRLFDGGAQLEGTALVVCTFGALEVTEGAASMRIDDVGITIEAKRGAVEFTDATGRTMLAPGSTKTIEHARATALR